MGINGKKNGISCVNSYCSSFFFIDAQIYKQKKLYEALLNDVQNEPIKSIRMAYLKNSPYYNALQVKFSYAITCHKSQGGQWPIVFIDQGFLTEENIDYGFLRWLYTVITRATEKVYLINFNSNFFN